MNLKPLHDLVYLELKETEEATTSGIVLTQRKEENIGVVVAVGPGLYYEGAVLVPPEVQIGDTVLFSSHAGQQFVLEGKKLLALHESQILAVIE